MAIAPSFWLCWDFEGQAIINMRAAFLPPLHSGRKRTPSPTKPLFHHSCHTDRAKRVERISIRVVGDADPYGCAENLD